MLRVLEVVCSAHVGILEVGKCDILEFRNSEMWKLWNFETYLSALGAESATVFFLREPQGFHVFFKPARQGALQTIGNSLWGTVWQWAFWIL